MLPTMIGVALLGAITTAVAPMRAVIAKPHLDGIFVSLTAVTAQWTEAQCNVSVSLSLM